MIQWEERLVTGNESIDRQHKLLFQFFNDLEDVIREGKSETWAKHGFHFLEDYVKAHFRYEENCMHQNQCPVAGKNKMAHEAFISVFEEYKSKLDKGGDAAQILTDLHHFLGHWIVSHIMSIDVHLNDCSHDKPAA